MVCDYLRNDFIQHADFGQMDAGNASALLYCIKYKKFSANGDQVY